MRRVGAGVSGLVAAKELLDEGHRVVCFEERTVPGGVFSDQSRDHFGSFRLTVSQHFMAFSSFRPPPGEKRRYWTRREYSQYLERFGERSGVLSCTQLDTRVTTVHKRTDGGLDVLYQHKGRNRPNHDLRR